VSRNLTSYERKRDPAKTPEPFGNAKRGRKPIFVVQRHDARRLHYDFRLELDGALASWAVPKGVPLEPGQQHLAVHVEDHPLEYAQFEGTIPAGQYGAGSVEIWDRGTFELVERKRDGGLTVRLHGERLDGTWALVPANLSGEEKNWLIVRKRDTEATGPTGPRRDYKPMLASLTDALPSGTDWTYEVKWDGYRALARVTSNEATLLSRNDNDFTERFDVVARALPHALRTPDCVLDGEVCALDERGRASFSAMQQGGATLVYYVFDLLELEGVPLVDLPLRERRERLEALLVPGNQHVRLSESFDDGAALFKAAQDAGLEGIMAKRPGSRYAEGKRTRDWLKLKMRSRQEFAICGYTKGQGRRAGSFGALVLGVRRGDELVFVGNCGTGFTEQEIERLLAKLRPLERATSPFAAVPKMPRVRQGDVAWVEPKLVCEVEFVEWTHDGHLRAPSYQGLREDKEAVDVKRETPAATERRKGKRTLKLSNLDKPFWAEEGITKGHLIAYYEAVAPVLLPHLKDRPFTMKRYPDGWNGPHFFQKDAPKHMPEWIPTVPVEATTREAPRRTRTIQAPLVNDELALLWMVNMGCIDMNTWYSRVDKPERPDWVLFDLDPSEGVPFSVAVQVALLIRETLDALGLVGFPKTSGSPDGLHVLVPIERRSTYSDTRQFAEIVAGAIARTHPDIATTQWVKAKRRGVLIDSNQNGAGKTIASVYSVRPHPGATVSTPLEWREVGEKLNPTVFSMDVVLDRVARKGDLFAGVLETRQSLARALKQVS
jgi:bifunctional non-homologous end joining protein LigD